MSLKELFKILIIVNLSFLIFGCASNNELYNIPKYNTDISTIDYSNSTFIIIGDTQRTGFLEQYFYFRESNDSIQFVLFDSISSLKQEPAFILHLGDMVYDGSSENDWRYFDASTKQIRNLNIPIIPVLGNHEYYGDSLERAKNINSRFNNLKDSSWKAFVFNNIGIILLNSNEELSLYQTEKQKSFFTNSINTFESDSNINYIIVATHHPPYTNGTGIGFDESEYVQNYFAEKFISSKKAGLFLSGHCHNYEHLLISDKHFIISGGGGGPRRKIDLDGDYIDITKGAEENEEERGFNFIEIEVLKDSLLIEVHSYNKDREEWYEGEYFKISN